MSNEKKSIHKNKSLGRKKDQESWTKTFLASKQNDHKKLLVVCGCGMEVDKISFQAQFELAMKTLKGVFHHLKLDSAERDLNKYISNLQK